jgi:predicted TIM-barrel fold metal-dependent hydrolase
MRDGCKVFDVDTHVIPNYEVLAKYAEPSFRPRLEEFQPYLQKRQSTMGPVSTLTISAIQFDRFPGVSPADMATRPKTARGAMENRAKNQADVLPRPNVQNEDSAGRLKDMDMEGRDIDLLIPGTWAPALSAVTDVTLTEGLYRAYHRYMTEYCSPAPGRLKGLLAVPGGDVDWAVKEIKRLRNEKWVAAVWPLLPEGMPIDDPRLDPIWAEMNDAHLPILFHSFFYEPPYFPGYRDVWGNVCVARTAAHPWSAARFLSYLIVGKVFDRFPNLNAAVAEVGHGWLPHWVIRLGFMTKYLYGSVPDLDYTPLEYVQMGRFRCGAEPFEGPEMTKACIDILGPDVLMHQSDYPHGECQFPDTAKNVMDWPIWQQLGPAALQKHMFGNAERTFRLL